MGHLKDHDVHGGTLDGTRVAVIGDPARTTVWEPLDDGSCEVYSWKSDTRSYVLVGLIAL